MTTNIPYARKLIEHIINGAYGPISSNVNEVLGTALLNMTRSVTKRSARANKMTPKLRAAVVKEMTACPECHDAEIALRAGFSTGAAAARVSEIRNGLL